MADRSCKWAWQAYGCIASMLNMYMIAKDQGYVPLVMAEGTNIPSAFLFEYICHMNEGTDDYWDEIEDAIHEFYTRSDDREQEFIDACQTLVDTGVWLIDPLIGETCLFFIEAGNLFLPEEDQESPDGDFVIHGTPRKFIVN